MWTRIGDIERMFGAMDLFRSRMNRVFTDFDRLYGEDVSWRATTDGAPKTNLYDKGDQFVVIAEVPGMTKEDINVRIQGNYLELSGNRRMDKPEGYRAHRVERPVTSFTRSFTMPSDVDADKVEASLQDGILMLTLPKAETAKPKQISIQ